MSAVKQVRKCFSMQWHNCSGNSELGGGGSNVAIYHNQTIYTIYVALVRPKLIVCSVHQS